MKLRYWSKTGLKMALILLVACGVYTALSILGAEEGESWKEALGLGGSYALALGTIFCFLLEVSVYNLYIPLAVSFGATRREAFWGVQACRGSYTLVLLLTGYLLLSLSQGGDFVATLLVIPVFLGIFLVSHGLAGLLAAVYGRFGAKGLILGCVLLLAAFVAGVAAFVIAIDKETMPDFSAGVSLGIVAVGTAVYLLLAPVEAKSIAGCTVKL